MRVGAKISPLFKVALMLLAPAGLAITLGGCPGVDPINNPAFDRKVVEATDPAGPLGPVAVVPADVNGDGKPDLVSAWRTSGQVRLHLQGRTDGAITWQSLAIASGSIAAGVQALASGDINGDGRDDIVAATSQGRILYIRQSGGDSADPANWAVSVIGASQGVGFDSWSDVQLADVDGDTRLEVLASLESQGGRICIFKPPLPLTSGNGWTRVDVATSGRDGASGVLAIDMDGNGYTDVLTIARDEGVDSVAWYANPGAALALIAPWVRHSVGSVQDPRAMALTYVDGDIFLDIVVASGDGRGLWGFQAPNNLTDLLDANKRWNKYAIASFGTDRGAGVCAAYFGRDAVTEIVASTTGAGRLSLYKWNPIIGVWAETVLDDTGGKYGRCLVTNLNLDSPPDLICTIDTPTGGQVVWYPGK
jgi:hypothetical protein